MNALGRKTEWRRRIGLLVSAGTLASLGLGCGASFKSVEAVGQAGAKIGATAPVIDSWENACRELQNLNPTLVSLKADLVREQRDAGAIRVQTLAEGQKHIASAHPAARIDPNDPCAQWKVSSNEIKQVALALAAFAAKLNAVATNADFAAGSKAAAAAVAAVGKAGWTADGTTSGIVKATVKLFESGYEKRELDRIIGENAKVIGDAVAELDQAAEIAAAETDLVNDSLESIRLGIDFSAVRRLELQDAGVPSLPVVTGLLIEAANKMEEDVSDQQESVANLRAAVDAFGKGYAALVASKGKLDTKDALAAVTFALGGTTAPDSGKK